ncbi:MAG: zinc ribbon domain-containing protein [Deltaproteobacteria bacterium]|uniref:Zinc ribbon domain-containing protein n=1 Tax=Candidatus Zymogenus saltonus TaxID=2844893 RepID=A0A9D8KGX6_9DELT|nr:zinc ribbon domain-containing protein [Candidatus Zymogenus saltonus]
MPLYEYRCKKCGNIFELFHRMSEDASDTPCPECGEVGPEKQMSAVSSVSKGGGESLASSSCGHKGHGGFS